MLQEQIHGENGGASLMKSKKILIALGSNHRLKKGSLTETLTAALKMLEIRGAVIRAVSSYYHTPAFPKNSGPDYLNAAAKLEIPWEVADILGHLHAIEAELGRVRGERWGGRTLDLDLLAVGDAVFPDAEVHQIWRDLPLEQQLKDTPDQLILPHPRLQDRAFVLVPLADIAPDWRHPLLDLTVTEMLAALPDDLKSEVRQAQ